MTKHVLMGTTRIEMNEKKKTETKGKPNKKKSGDENNQTKPKGIFNGETLEVFLKYILNKSAKLKKKNNNKNGGVIHHQTCRYISLGRVGVVGWLGGGLLLLCC